MQKLKKRSRIMETKNFGLILGLIIFLLFIWLSYGIRLITVIEETFSIDLMFNYKLQFSGEVKESGVDQRGKNPFISDDILIIGIDNKSLKTFGSWPFPRTIEANMINTLTRIKEQGERERALFIDINFIDPDIKNPENDVTLINAIEENKRVFLETFVYLSEFNEKLSKDHFSRHKELEKTLAV